MGCRTALHYAAMKGNVTIIKMMESEFQADLGVLNAFGQTLLHAAAELNQPVSIVYLLSKGFDINSRDNDGESALHYAAEAGNINALGFLLADDNCDIEAKN